MSVSLPIDLSLPARIGRVWFQWRSFSPVPLFLLLVLLPQEFVPGTADYVLAICGAVLGETLRLWGVGYAGSATRTRGDKIPELVTAGPYRYVRNPLYVGNLLLYTSCAFAFGSNTLTLGIFIYTLIQYSLIIRYEESMLLHSFGEPYARYQQVVPRWVPLFQPGIASSSHQFELKRALRSERSTFYCMGAMIVLLVLKNSL